MEDAVTTVADAAKRLATALRNDRESISFFVGAGISKRPPCALPDWTEFRNAMLDTLLDRLYNGGLVTSYMRDVVSRDLLGYDARYESPGGLWLKPEVVLHWIQAYIPGTVRAMLNVFASGAPNRNHAILAQLAARRRCLIATCNFDTNTERALESLHLQFQRFAGARPARSCKSFREYIRFTEGPEPPQIPILKIHGCASAPSTIRATLEQVSRHTCLSHREALRRITAKRVLVVAGYSGRDRDIRPEIEAAASHAEQLWWIARDAACLIPEVRRIPKISIAFGDVNDFFDQIAAQLGIRVAVETAPPTPWVSHLQQVARFAGIFPTALALCELAMHIGCRASVEILALQVIESCRSPQWKALAWMSLGDTKRRENPIEALDCFQRAEHAARELRSSRPLLYGHALKYLAAQHYVLGEIDKALSVNTRCLAWVRKSRDRATEGRVLDDRAIIYRQRGNPRYAIRLRKRAASLLDDVGDVLSLAMVYNNMGKDYDFLEDFPKAEMCWRKSLELKEKETSNSPDLGRTYFNIGELLRHTERNEEALPFLRQAQARAGMHGDHVVEARAFYSLAAIAHSKGKAKQAKGLLARGIQAASTAADWSRHPGRLRWAREIEEMIRGQEVKRQDRMTPASKR